MARNDFAKPTGRLFYGWHVVFSAATILLITGATFFYGFGVFFKPIIDEFGWSNTQVAFATTLRSEVSAFAAPLIGYSVDRFGVRQVLLGGVLFVGLGFIALSQVWDLPTYYAAMCVIAIGTSASGGSAGTVAIARWFVRLRSRALALMTVGAGFGGVTVPIIALLVTAYGWRTALIIMGVFVIITGVPLARMMRERPEDMGLHPDGADRPAHYDTSVSEEENARRARERALQGMTVKQALRSRPFWQLTVAMMLVGTANTAVVVYQVPVMQHAGVSTELAALSVTGLTLLSVIGRMGFGWMGDFRDKRMVIGGCFVLQMAGMVLFTLLTGGATWLIIPFLLVFSPGFGGPIPLRPALMAEYFGTRSLGSIQGSFMFANTIGGVVGPLLVGYLYDTTASYQLGFWVMTAFCAVAVPIILLLPRPQPAPAIASNAGVGAAH